jgi:predicted transglutaminase-like cysteine proteinase
MKYIRKLVLPVVLSTAVLISPITCQSSSAKEISSEARGFLGSLDRQISDTGGQVSFFALGSAVGVVTQAVAIAYRTVAVGLRDQYAEPAAESMDSAWRDPARDSPIRPVAMKGSASGVFGSVAIPFAHLNAMTRWKPILAQINSDNLESCLGTESCSRASSRIQRAVLATSAMPSLIEKLQTINTSVNRSIAYVADRALYGKVDYWAEPSETLSRGKGDCEDFAILKMAALHEAGIPTSSMSLVVLRDRKRGFFHAVLAVSTTGGDFILDILNDRVSRDTSYPDYQPLYSIADNNGWIHGYSGAKGYASNSFNTVDVAPGTGPVGSLPSQFLGSKTTLSTGN